MRGKVFRIAKGYLLSLYFRRNAVSFDPKSSYMKDQSLQDRLIDELAEVAGKFFAHHIADIIPSGFSFRDEVRGFWQIYRERPFDHNTGGSGFHNQFWIYLFSRALDPDLIVESGVWKGHTSWLLEQSCPRAEIHGFDITLRNLEHHGKGVQFHEDDWGDYLFSEVNPEKAFVFFDCHVNHLQRILEARKKGFRHLLFDDNPPAHKLYSYAVPGFPTVNMIVDKAELNFEEISWRRQGNEKSYHLEAANINGVRNLIQKHEVFPDVGGPTRYGGFSFLTYVRLNH